MLADSHGRLFPMGNGLFMSLDFLIKLRWERIDDLRYVAYRRGIEYRLEKMNNQWSLDCYRREHFIGDVMNHRISSALLTKILKQLKE